MAPVDTCLKRGFITFNVILGILGTILLALSLFFHGHFHKNEEIDKLLPGIAVMYVIGLTTVAMSAFGLYGALKERKWALILFSVGMIVMSLILVGLTAQAVYEMSQMRAIVTETFHISNGPLNETSDLGMVHGLQIMLECCGINGYQDWQGHIPDTCLCFEQPESLSKCVTVPVFNVNGTTSEDKLVYRQPCLPLLLQSINLAVGRMLAITFGFKILVLIATGLAIAMLCQMGRKTIAPPVTFRADPSGAQYTALSNTA